MSQEMSVILSLQTAQAIGKLNSFLEQANVGLKSFSLSVASAFGVGFSVAGFIRITENAINSAEALGRLSIQTDFSIESLNAIRKQANESGISFDDLGTSLSRFVAKMEEARIQGGTSMDVFRQLGHDIALAVAEGRPVEEVYGMIADKFKDGAIAGKEAAVAQELFGRQFRQWIPLLKQGSDGLEKMKEQGGGITPDAVLKATEFNRALRDLEEQINNIARGVASEMLPTLQGLTNYLLEATKSSDAMKNAVSILVDAFKLLSIAAIIGASFMAFSAASYVLRGSLLAVSSAVRILLGYSISDFFIVATGSVSGFTTAVSLLALRLASLIPLLGLVAVGITAAKNEWDMFKAKLNETQTEINIGGQLDQFNKTLQANIDSLVKSGDMTASHAKQVKSLMNEIRIGYANGTIGADNYSKALASVADQLKKIHPAAFPNPKDNSANTASGGNVLNPNASSPNAPAPPIALSEEAQRLVEKIDEEYAESTKSKIALLDLEEAARKHEVDEEVFDVTVAEQKKAEITAIYAAKRLDIERKAQDEKNQIYQQQIKQQQSLIESNPYASALEKARQLTPVLEMQAAIVRGERDQADLNVKNSVGDQKIAAMKELVRLQGELNDLEREEQKNQVQLSFTDQIKSQFTTLLDSVNKFAEDAGKLLMSPIEGFRTGFASALNKMILTGKFSFSTIALAMGSAIRQAFVNMVADWVTSHVVMAGISTAWNALLSALGISEHAAMEEAKNTITIIAAGQRITIRTGEAVHDAAMTSVQVSTHVAGEGTKTAATSVHAIMRGVIRIGETILHGVLVAIRVAAHIAGEILSTTVTLAQTAIRGLAYVIEAALAALVAMASIPVVGPILAIAAAAAMVAVGMGLLGGFEGGGYTGDGPANQPAGIVHRGEYVIPANRVSANLPLLQSIHSGAIGILPNVPSPVSSFRESSSGGGTKMEFHVHNWNDEEAMNNHLKNNPQANHIILDKVRRNAHVIPSRT